MNIRRFVIGFVFVGAVTAIASGQTTWHVDDNAPGDPGPGDPGVSDPLENGSPEHPFDAIQEAIDAAAGGDTVLVAAGVYSGAGNRDLDSGGTDLTVRGVSGAENCIIDCEAAGRGFFFHGGESELAIVDGFTIKNGQADTGGGIACTSFSHPTLMNCIITANTATDSGGGLHLHESCSRVVNCLITNNVASTNGGGIYCQTSTANIVNCTIADNQGGNSGGGAQIAVGSDVSITNCIFATNSAREGDELRILGSSNPSSLTITYTNILGGQESIDVHSDCTMNWGDGNIDAEPLFYIPSAYGYRLDCDSPCIDAGTNAPNGGLPPVDLVGNPRPLDGDADEEPWSGQAETADIGAYESPSGTEPRIYVFPKTFHFHILSGISDMDSRLLHIRNCGVETLNWEIVEDCEWLTATPPAGESSGEMDDVLLGIDASGLVPGEYYCELLIVDPAASNSPMDVVLVLSVLDPIYVDDDSPDDPGAGDPSISDPLEDGSPEHPFDAVQEAIDAASTGHVVAVEDGVYTGEGNRDLEYQGKNITVRSINGAENCIIDCESSARGFFFHNGESRTAMVDGFTITNGEAGYGGGVFCNNDSHPTISNCIITGNTAENGGGGVCLHHSDARIAGCLIIDNTCDRYSDGAGIRCRSSSAQIVNCTIADNACNDGDGGGTQIIDGSHVSITNCIYAYNTADTGSHITASGSPYTSTLTISYSSFQGGSSTIHIQSSCTLDWGDGNLYASPVFINRNDGNYRLDLDSPCIDAGTNAPDGGLPPVDLDGVQRPLDGDADVEPWSGQGKTADMGAFEAPAIISPRICLSDTLLEFWVMHNGPKAPDQSIYVWNCGVGTLTWEVVEDCHWLIATPSSGEATAERDEIVFSIEAAGLPLGEHHCALLVVDPSASNNPIDISIVLHVLPSYHVDDDAPGDPGPGNPGVSDPLEDGSPEHPFDAIQEAIDAAVEGHEIILADGVYTGAENRDIDLHGKWLLIRSENGSLNCMIDCQQAGRAFVCHNHEPRETEIRGITIMNGLADTGGGISCRNASKVLINGCRVVNCEAARGGGLFVHSSAPTVRNCLIADNTASDNGGGMMCRNADIIIENCTIANNTAVNISGGVHIAGASTAVMPNTIVADNQATEGADVSLQGADNPSSLTVDYCAIPGGPAAMNVNGACTLVWGVGNLTGDPHLTGDGCHLLDDSPCRDAGDPAGDFAGQCDIDGEARVFENRVDIGADEFIDTDADGLPDWWEELYFGDALAADPDADTDEDGERNIEEYIAGENPLLGRHCSYVSQTGCDSWDGLSPVCDGVHGPKRTIRAGMAAADGDLITTVIIGDGVYTGPDNRELDFEGKAITVRSANGAESCIIDCELEGIAFHFRNGETQDSLLEDLTMMFPRADDVPDYFGAAVVCENGAAPTISRCHFSEGEGAVTCDGNGEGEKVDAVQITDCQIYKTFHTITVTDCGSADVNNCVLLSNETLPNGYGVVLHQGVLRMTRCSVSGYRYGVGGRPYASNHCWIDGSLYLTDCLIEFSGFREHDEGVGLCVSGGDVVEIRDCIIRDNAGGDNIGLVAYAEQVLIDGCVIDNNYASGSRAGIAAGGKAIIRNCEVTNNSSRCNAGIVLDYDGYGIQEGLLSNCRISDNSSEVCTAGITTYGLSYVSGTCKPSIRNCTLANNVGDFAIINLDFYYTMSTEFDSMLHNVHIINNTLRSEGILMDCSRSHRLHLSDCVFAGNVLNASNSPLLRTQLSEQVVLNGNTFVNNSAIDADSLIYVEDGARTITNNIIWNNATLGGEQIHFDEFTENDVFLNNDVQGGAAAISVDEGEFVWDESNIDADPMFVDPDGPDDDPATWEDNDYRLSGGSPCIDAGHNGYVPADVFDLDDDGDVTEPVPFDFDGLPRFFDDAGMPDDGAAGDTGLPIVDMGAFEHHGETCYGDLTGDNRVTLNDLAHLLGHYGLACDMTYPNGDFDRDGDVDMNDLNTLLGLYGHECPQ